MKFDWMNESTITEKDGRIEIYAPERSDIFCNNGDVGEEGLTPGTICNAPFYYTEITGDFVMRARVSLKFITTFDSACIMVWQDETHWAKACFEKTEYDTHAVVSVVTKDTSDDANGCNIEEEKVWLKVSRRGSAFAFHYSTDGENYYMMRFFILPADDTMKAGLLAQAPQGEGGMRVFEDFSIENKTVKNIRMGR